MDQQEAAAVQHLVTEAGFEFRAEGGQQEVAGTDGGNVGVACDGGLGGGFDLGKIDGGELHPPIGAGGHLGADPGGGVGLFGREVHGWGV